MVSYYKETSIKIMLGYLVFLVLLGLTLPYVLDFFGLSGIVLLEITTLVVISLSAIALIVHHYSLNKVDERMIEELANKAHQEGLPDKAKFIKQNAKKILKKI